MCPTISSRIVLPRDLPERVERRLDFRQHGVRGHTGHERGQRLPDALQRPFERLRLTAIRQNFSGGLHLRPVIKHLFNTRDERVDAASRE